jgi:hypothetical protein
MGTIVGLKHTIARGNEELEVLVYARIHPDFSVAAETVMRRLGDGAWFPMDEDALDEYGVNLEDIARRIERAAKELAE